MPTTHDAFATMKVHAEDFLRLVSHAADAILLLDERGHVLTWNDGARAMKGWEADEICGRHFSAFYPPDEVARGLCEKELEVASRTGRFDGEGWRLRKDGSRFWASVSITALRDEAGTLRGFGKVTRDLTARKVAEDALRESEERFRLTVSSVRDYAIINLDVDGRVSSWNVGAQRIKGYSPEEILGKHFKIFYPPGVERWQSELEATKRDGRFEEEGWRVRKDGSKFWANVVMTALREENGELRGFVKITRDITERREAEERQRRLIEKLAISNRELEEFATVASHDLQEPLRKVQAFGDRLRERLEKTIDPESRGDIERMQKATSRMQTLINDLLSFSRVMTRGQPFERVSLATIFDEVRGDLETRIAESGARIEVDSLPEIDADPVQMRQLFQNLVGNALKFRKEGTPPVVRVRSERDGANVRLSVEDNGIGFDEKYLDRLFKIFQRLHGKSAYPGTGVGLAICRRIAQRHGGSISARSAPGAGATFVVTLPREHARDTQDETVRRAA